VRISISGLRALILLSRGRINSIVTPMGSGRPDDQRIKIPTVCTNAFYSGYSRTLAICTSILSPIVLTNKDFD
jgi:hypothetical protein